MISLFVALLALHAPAGPPLSRATPSQAEAGSTAAPSVVSNAALHWLSLVDDGQWAESWAATASSFQSLNTVEAWRAASEKARVPLGRVLTRKLLSEQDVPAPPDGYRMVRFQTDFANRRGAIETLSLSRDGEAWKVAGVYIE